MTNPQLLTPAHVEATGELLRQAGKGGPFELRPLAGGANNRVFRVDGGRRPQLLKAYFSHPDDPRDRLSADFGFSRFTWHQGIRALPEPLACDPVNRLGLYEFVEGRKLQRGEVTQPVVREALEFFLAINRRRDVLKAPSLPLASEACFSLKDHLHCVRRRIRRLEQIAVAAPVDQEALQLVQERLAPTADVLERAVADAAAAWSLPLDRPIERCDWRLSPSDFGFHNALRTPRGELKFFDFEYAGWDDPGKLVADFFCQPECPVPLEFFEDFAAAAAQDLTDPDGHLRRFRLLLPAYRLKWCCIMLNDFLPASNDRRAFARGDEPPLDRKARQLDKVRGTLDDSAPHDRWLRAS